VLWAKIFFSWKLGSFGKKLVNFKYFDFAKNIDFAKNMDFGHNFAIKDSKDADFGLVLKSKQQIATWNFS